MRNVDHDRANVRKYSMDDIIYTSHQINYLTSLTGRPRDSYKTNNYRGQRAFYTEDYITRWTNPENYIPEHGELIIPYRFVESYPVRGAQNSLNSRDPDSMIG